MPPSFKKDYGLEGVVEWAKNWNADAIIGQFSSDEKVERFGEEGIIAIAQDYQTSFRNIPNITAEYRRTGVMAADYFLHRGFRNFAFYGYAEAVWSHERGEGFKERIREKGGKLTYTEYENIPLDSLWYYDSAPVVEWLRSIPLPAALFACDDTQAYKLIEICNVLGIRIPEELVVLGVDNDEMTCDLSAPSLSSIDMNIEKAGYETAALIDRMLADPSTELQDIVIKSVSVVSRMSTDIYATDNPNIRKVLTYIHTHYTRRITVSEILEEVPLSRRLLEMQFKDVVGMGVYSYIKKLRMDKLAESLLSSDDTVGTIAARLGFDDPKNISRQFKQVKGCTPEEYRRRKKIK